MINDKEIEDIIQAEEIRQQNEICLIASENLPSTDAMKACGSIMMAKYSEGYPRHRYYGGCVNVDALEDLARKRACELFGAEHANVQPPSGSHANQCAYASILNIGDTILAPSLQSGGHLTHSSPVSFVTKLYNVVPYDVNKDTYLLDYDEIERLAEEYKPKLILCGYSAYSRLLDFERFRKIADKVGAYLMCDMAHFAGLVAAKVIPSPVPYCDIVTTTTHKTLRGVRGGLILCKKELAKAIDKAVFPQNAGGCLQNMVAGKAICFKEDMSEDFKEYAKQVLLNAKVLCANLKKEGMKILTDGTENHLMVIDLRGTGVTGAMLEHGLEQVGVATNKNSIPFDTEKPTVTSGLRIGTPSVTTRGMKEQEMILIAKIISNTFNQLKEHGELSENFINLTSLVVKQLTDKFPIAINEIRR